MDDYTVDFNESRQDWTLFSFERGQLVDYRTGFETQAEAEQYAANGLTS